MLLGGLVLGGVLLAAGRRHRQWVARVAERERVVSAVQDTLLQNIQGLVLRFQSVSHRLPDDCAERAVIETILDQADEVLAEVRNRMAALRDID